jgi:hypothetical protein
MFTEDPEISQAGGFKNMPKGVKAGMGLTLDIFLDPTTYVGAGPIVKGLKGAGIIKGKKGLEIPRGTPVPSQAPTPQAIEQTSKIIEAATRATGMMPEGATAIPAASVIKKSKRLTKDIYAEDVVHDTLERVGNLSRAGKYVRPVKETDPKKAYAVDFSNLMKQAQHSARLGRNPGFYGQVQRAEQLLNRIAQSDPQAVMRAAPKSPVGKPILAPAEKSLAIMTARDTSKKLKVSNDKHLNPKQQLVIFKNLLSRSPGGPIERMSTAAGMMRAAEKYLTSQGYGFKYWDGTGVKLTDIFDELGGMQKVSPDILRQLESNKINFPPLDQAVEAVRARSAMKDSKFVQLGLDEVTDSLARAKGLTTPARSEQIGKGLAEDLRMGLKGANVSPAAVKTGSALYNIISQSQITATQRAMSATSQVAHDIMNARVNKQLKISRENKIDKAIERHMNSRYRTVATELGNKNKAIEFLGERFAAHYGQSTLRPVAQDYLLSAQANAQVRSKYWSGIIRGTTLEARREALRAAQNMSRPGVMPPGDVRLAQEFRNSIERLFSSTGIKDTAASVATRAAFTMKDINSELRRIGSDFQFTNAKNVEDEFGNFHDFSKNVDWLQSWEAHKFTGDPVKFIHELEVAAEKTSKRYALLDEIGARFSQTTPTGAFRHLAEDPRLAGHYFTQDIVVQVNQMNKMLKNAYSPQNDFIKTVDRITSAWKSGVTIYAPSHHIRNLIGDSWLSWIAGVNSPKPYYAAAKVLKANWSRYDGAIPNMESLIAPGAMQQALTRPGSIITKTRSGIKLTAEQIYIAAHQRGLLLSARALDDIYGEDIMPKVFGGKVQGYARGAAETREHYIRLAHFIDGIQKGKGKNLKEIFDNSAHTVRKWHPDGMDLTDFERKYLRRIFPFYSWTRKAFPLVFESMVMKPGKVMVYPKGMEALQAAMGIDAERTDPFPSDQMFPDWMKEKGIGPIAATNGPLGALAALSRQGETGGYTILNPSNPMIDVISQFGGMGNPRAPLQAVGSSLNPLARVPIEVTTDKQMFTDVPVSYDPNKYATEQIPAGALISRMTNMGIFGPTERGKKEGLGNTEAIINYLTAAGLLGTGPYIKQAEYEEKSRASKRRKEELEKFLSQIGTS